MPKQTIATGAFHTTPADLKKVLTANPDVLEKWNSLTPLARNEWICWVTSVKKAETRTSHLKRLREDLRKGKRRPCCWIGCTHRTDKPMSSSQKFILKKQPKKK